ncbi:MAG: amidohydrolase family protein [Rhizobiales bacterium]|nr:amidohydrolase family protein [Hyphomicrobiales bacterium]
MDETRRIITDGAVAVTSDRISFVGKSADLPKGTTAKQVIDGRRFVLTPGFVNGHIHVTGEPLTRGYIPDDTGFEENVWRWLIPLYQTQTPEDEYLSARLAALEMLRSGATCFLEAGTILDMQATAEGLNTLGIRGRIGAWIEDRAFDPAEDQKKKTDLAIRKLQDEMAVNYGNDPLIRAWPLLVGHSTATDEVWLAAKALADSNGGAISAHMSPAQVDVDWFMENTGKRPIEYLAELGVLGNNVSLTHAVHLDMNEVKLLAETGANICHCPLSALKGGYGATAVGLFPEMAEAGVNITLGTDGNNNGNASEMMRTIYLVAGLFKDARGRPDVFSAYQALEMATLGGARAMGLQQEIGSIELGKKADFVLHDTDRPEWRPLHNVANQLVWSADGRGVHSVWVNGVRVIDNYHSTMIDEEKLYADAQVAGEAIVKRSGLPAVSAWPIV